MTKCWEHKGAVLATLALVLVACANPPPAPMPVPPPALPPPVAPQPPTPPAPPAQEPITPAQAKAQAQKLTSDAVTQLDNGQEAGARRTLEHALALDPLSDQAKKLMDQINADPQVELGAAFFRYTVQREETLSKIAQQYLGDRLRFWILAKYNDIPIPNRLQAEQVIKIPVKSRPPAPPRAGPSSPASSDKAPKDPAPDPPTPRSASAALVKQGMDREASGDLAAAYEAFREAAERDSGNKDAAMHRDRVRQTLVGRYEREANQAFQRQKLDEAIDKWDRVLQLEPNNRKAKLERERAVDLRNRIENFGAK